MPLRRKLREPQYVPFAIIKPAMRPRPWWEFVSLYDVSFEERLAT
jgi:hypothetical protein